MAIVKIKPIEREKWHGKKGNESFTRPTTIRALVNVDSMTYATGLTEEEAKEYGEKLKIDLSNQFNLEEPHPFWDTKAGEIKLENRTMLFDTENPLDFIKVKVCKASRFVANSLKEYEEGMFPEATHIIFDESEEIEEKASKIEIKKKAVIETAKLSKDRKIQMILILSADGNYLKAKNLKGKSDNFIEVELDKLIESKADEVLRYLKMNKDDTATQALVLEALQRHIFEKVGHKIMYHDSTLGEDIYDVVNYLNAPENQEFKIRILAQVNE
jgi:hypothetical protein